MMKSMGSFQGFVVGVALVSISFLVLVGCADQNAAKKDDQAQGAVALPRSEGDFKSGDLIVDWGTKRSLDMVALKYDLDKNGVPGGGKTDEIVMITFYRADGTSFVADMNGAEVRPCATVSNGRIESNSCTGLTSDLSNEKGPMGLSILGIQKVTINTQRNPRCSVDFYCNYAVEGCRSK